MITIGIVDVGNLMYYKHRTLMFILYVVCRFRVLCLTLLYTYRIGAIY